MAAGLGLGYVTGRFRNRRPLSPEMKKMNVLMLNYEFPPIGGGAGKAHSCLLKQYAQIDELTVDVLTSAPKPGFFQEKLCENITIHKVGIHKKNLHYWRKAEVIEWLIKARPRYRKMSADGNYDLIHAFFAFPSAFLCYKTADRLPFIISLRGSDVPGYNVRLGLDYKLLAPLFRKIWSSASAVVANSSGLKELALEFMPGLDIEVIPNGIDTEKFHPSSRKSITKPIQLLTVGRLISRKRIDLLIEAVGRLRQLGLDVELNIAGGGNLTNSLQKLTEQLGVADSVNFMGRVPAEDLPQLYRDSDIFVTGSAHEGMSNAMLEAMASGLPIVTTYCEGTEELIADNGTVVEKADAEAIAEAVKTVVDDENLYKSMCTASRKRAEDFSWAKTARQYLEHYKTILSGAGDR